jgi:hypothetical protein
MAVKIETLEKVPPHVPSQPGLVGPREDEKGGSPFSSDGSVRHLGGILRLIMM